MFMNYRFPATAKWYGRYIGDDNETLRNKVKAYEFQCVDLSNTLSAAPQQIDQLTGTIKVKTLKNLLLRTNDPKAKDFKDNDTIEFKGETYHVTQVFEVRSNAYLGALEYDVYCA
jgi:hypothetical protein